MLLCMVILVWSWSRHSQRHLCYAYGQHHVPRASYQCAKHVSAVQKYHHINLVICVTLLVRLTSVAVFHCACTCRISHMLYAAPPNYQMLHFYVLCASLMQGTLRTLDVDII